MKKTISVSHLAAYCDDPKKFIRLRGAAENITAARRGEDLHNAVGKSSTMKRVVVFALLLGGLVWILKLNTHFSL